MEASPNSKQGTNLQHRDDSDSEEANKRDDPNGAEAGHPCVVRYGAQSHFKAVQIINSLLCVICVMMVFIVVSQDINVTVG